VDVRTPELLRKIAGSHSGFVLRNVSGLLNRGRMAVKQTVELNRNWVVGKNDFKFTKNLSRCAKS